MKGALILPAEDIDMFDETAQQEKSMSSQIKP